MKLVVDRESDRVLGVHMVGPDAGEIVQGFGVALKCNATKAPDPRAVFQALRPVFNDYVSEIQRSIGYFASVNRSAGSSPVTTRAVPPAKP